MIGTIADGRGLQVIKFDLVTEFQEIRIAIISGEILNLLVISSSLCTLLCYILYVGKTVTKNDSLEMV